MTGHLTGRIEVAQGFLRRTGGKGLITGNYRIAECWLVQQRRLGMKGAFGRRGISRFQGQQCPAMVDPPPCFAALTVDHFPDVIVGQGVRSPVGRPFGQQAAV
jgi:hypothetical protein